MAYIPKRFVGPYNLIDSYQTVFLATSKTIIKQIILSNVTGTAATVRISLTNFSTGPDTQNAIMQDVEIEANSTLIADLALVMESLDKLHARASISGAVNLTVSGVYNYEIEE